jgi:PRTRC genetic system ThiF family protein
LFSDVDLGQNKASVLATRINRSLGCAFKAVPYKFCLKNKNKLPQQGVANITVSCVDTAAARFGIADMLQQHDFTVNHLLRPIYWMDLGNSQHKGQVLLSTIGSIKQPNSKKYNAVSELPFITSQYKTLLQQSDDTDHTPSCSLAEALTKQDLFINSTLANMGASLLWKLFREGMTEYKGFFMNLKDFRTTPIPV